MPQTTNNIEDSSAGRNGARAPHVASRSTPNGEVGHQEVPQAAPSTPRDPGALIHEFNASHLARRQLYRTAIHAEGAAAQQAQAQADTDLKQAVVAYDVTERSADPSRTGSLPLRYGLAAGTIAVDGLSTYLAAQVAGISSPR